MHDHDAQRFRPEVCPEAREPSRFHAMVVCGGGDARGETVDDGLSALGWLCGGDEGNRGTFETALQGASAKRTHEGRPLLTRCGCASRGKFRDAMVLRGNRAALAGVVLALLCVFVCAFLVARQDFLPSHRRSWSNSSRAPS